jgi:hypothetical protein
VRSHDTVAQVHQTFVSEEEFGKDFALLEAEGIEPHFGDFALAAFRSSSLRRATSARDCSQASMSG